MGCIEVGFVFFVGDVAEVVAGYVHDGYGGDTFDGDDHAQVLLDALDHTGDTCVGTISDAGFHAGFTGEVEVVEEDDVVAALFCQTDEGLHHAIGYIESLGGGLLAIKHGTHDVAEGFVEELVLTHLRQVIVGAAHEDDVVDGWDEGGVVIFGLVDHRHVGLLNQFFLIQPLFHCHET